MIIRLFSLILGQLTFIGITARVTKIKIIYLKLILALVISSLAFLLFKNVGFIYPLLMFMTVPLSFIVVFNLKSKNAFVGALFIYFVIAITETILFIIPYFASNLEAIKSNDLFFLLCNILVYAITYIIFINRKIKRIYLRMLEESFITINGLIFSISLMIVISLMYNLYMKGIIAESREITIIILLFIIFLMGNAIYKMIKYYELKAINSGLHEYVTKFEEIIDRYELNNHEHNNQLAVIKAMSKNKKVKSYIDGLIKIEDEGLNNFNLLPEGGIKGVIVYKQVYYANKGVEFNYIIAKEVKKIIKNLSITRQKHITNLLGVYMDNACEEAIISKGKVTIEMYLVDDEINIVISNKLNGMVNRQKLATKSYSSKSLYRGKGLYLTQKLIDKKYGINLNTKIINDYFIQEIKIRKTIQSE